MACRRCSMCSMSWPDLPLYERCPQCQDRTDRFSDQRSIPEAEALSLKKHAEFARYYEARGAR